MNIERRKKILDFHFTPWFERDGRLYADSMLADTSTFEEVIDITDWTLRELYDWLGY